MPKIDIARLPVKTGSGYPDHRAAMVGDRRQVALGDPSGLTQFGANLVTLGPGALSSLRHWHEQQDEFLVVTAGVCTLIDDSGETELRPGDCAAFPAGDANGHHLVNKTDADASFVVVGTRTPTEVGYYSDEDMMVTVEGGTFNFTRKDGSALE
ncbi:cupin domain-containing protein [uncultured Litoreibacter sp.]|uniref:cupin domain-containing protein n=1 Tax=uncultured Litoreibacter sp. TaxID=1392394 RepID=UPI00261E74BB|nr:cupin domain-containing protein [uncultured Litoreibacter sp.]